jgi:hypothetical protein
MRVSDHDRQQAADRLRVAQNEGRLSISEYDTRLGRVYEAKTFGEVADLFIDLPNPAQPPFPQPFPQPPLQQPFMAQPPPMTGNFAGPAAVVHNNIVMPGPLMVTAPNSGAATAGLVFGILGLLGFWIPFGDIVFSALAVLLSAIGLSQTNDGRLGGRGRAVAGLICGLVGLIPAVIVIALLITAAAVI